MLFIIICVVVLVGCFLWYKKDDMAIAPGVVGALLSFALIGMAVGVICANTCLPAKVARLEERREMLIYEYVNDVFENDNDLGKAELLNKIQNWNEDCVSLKLSQKNPWTGIFIPNIYDKFEPIDLSTIVKIGDVNHDGKVDVTDSLSIMSDWVNGVD